MIAKAAILMFGYNKIDSKLKTCFLRQLNQLFEHCESNEQALIVHFSDVLVHKSV